MQFYLVKREQLFFFFLIFIYGSVTLLPNASIQIPASPFSNSATWGTFINASWASVSATENGDNNDTSS